MKVGRCREAGYTLIELMIVVVIAGVLATLAVYGVRHYIMAAKTSEATSMIATIKAAQENFRDETFSYLDVSGGDLTNYYPRDPGPGKVSWQSGEPTLLAAWNRLGVASTDAVLFSYSTIAGGAADAPPTSMTGLDGAIDLPNPPGRPWYIVAAACDQDEDGDKFNIYVATSFSTDIYYENEGE